VYQKGLGEGVGGLTVIEKVRIVLNVNGEALEVFVEPGWTLLRVLREELELTGAKLGCGDGECGACTVILDGNAVPSCLVLTTSAEGSEIETIEGLREGGELHPLQRALIEHGAVQCGFCTPGMIMSAKALLDENPNPTEDDVREALQANLCRCTGYKKVVEAVMSVAGGEG
jgi:carbon-monoxide dehydrogenase small subunit